MPTLKRSDLNRWNADAGNGFRFDIDRFILWGEKQLRKNVKTADGGFLAYILTYYEVDAHSYSGYLRGEKQNVPTLTITKWSPTSTDGVYMGGRPDRYALGEAQPKKNFKQLCKLSHEIDISIYPTEHLTSGAYRLT